jgi:hypothetical protein
MDNKEKTCNCSECGQDLYDENNILLELKQATDFHINMTNADVIGRPLYIISIGECGYEMTLTEINPNNKMMDNFLISCLKRMIKTIKKEKHHKKE